MYMKRVAPRRGPSRKLSRGQAEVLGGLIVLTILFAMAVPLLLSYVQRASEVNQLTELEKTRVISALNEKITISGVPPTDPDYPAIWLNNTGTVTVKLEYLYLIDSINKEIIYVLDLKYLRKSLLSNNPELQSIVRDIKFFNTSEPPPGQPLILTPGASVKILINGTNELIKNKEKYIVIRVESVPGVIHPVQDLTSATLEPIPSLFGLSGGGNVYLKTVLNLTNITSMPEYEALMTVPGYLAVIYSKFDNENSFFDSDDRYPPYNIYSLAPEFPGRGQGVKYVEVYKLAAYSPSNPSKLVPTIHCYSKSFDKVILSGAYLLKLSDEYSVPGVGKTEVFVSLATDFSIHNPDEGWFSSSRCGGPYTLSINAPNNAISLIHDDLNNDGKPDIELKFNTADAFNISTPLRNVTLTGIGALNFTVDFTLETKGPAIMLVDMKYVLTITPTPENGLNIEMNDILRYNPPLIALVLYHKGSDGKFYPIQQYLVQYYRDVLPATDEDEWEGSLALSISSSIKDMLYNLPPGDYKLSIIIFDALPNAYIDLTIKNLCISVLAVG